MKLHRNIYKWGETETIIVEDGDGFIKIQYDNDLPENGFIESLSVISGKRCMGIGNLLLRAAELKITEKGKKYARLYVEKDTWLVDWYLRNGYSIAGEVDETYLDMIKKL